MLQLELELELVLVGPAGLAGQLMPKMGGVLATLAMASGASGDPTGVSDALTRVAGLLAGIAGGLTALALVVLGLLYVMSIDDVGRATYLRRAAGALLVGLVLILLGTTIAPHLIQTITNTGH